MFDQGLLLASAIYTGVVIGLGLLMLLGTAVYLSLPWLGEHRPARVATHRRTHGGPRLARLAH